MLRSMSWCRWLTGALLLLTLPGQAADSPIWEVRGEGSFLLGGTIHVLRPGDFPPPAVFDAAYEASSKVVLETDLAGLMQPQVQRLLMERGLQPGGRTLADDLQPEVWARLQEVAAAVDLDPALLTGMRPGFAGLTLMRAMLMHIGVTEVGIDGYFHRRARADGRPMAGLESASEQVTLLLSLGEDDPDRFLDSSLDELERLVELMDAAVAAWRKGDYHGLHASLIEPTRAADPLSYQRLYTERNEAWLPQLRRYAADAERQLVLVGAGHLGGEDGLLAGLQAAGYELRPWHP